MFLEPIGLHQCFRMRVLGKLCSHRKASGGVPKPARDFQSLIVAEICEEKLPTIGRASFAGRYLMKLSKATRISARSRTARDDSVNDPLLATALLRRATLRRVRKAPLQ